MVKVREMGAGRWETLSSKALDKWKKDFPICPMSTQEAQHSMQQVDKWEIFLPFDHDMRGEWTSGKQGQPID